MAPDLATTPEDDDERFEEGPGVMPDEATWARLSAAQREAVLDDVLDDLRAREELAIQTMAEGESHASACDDMRDTLRAYFRSQNRSIYIASNLPVCYPKRVGFAPDVLGVTDVDPKPREEWVVADEGKGLDVVIEVYHKGSWRKDFVDNVKRYAQLGIREYFVFDLKRGYLKGYRLPPGKRRYDPLTRDLGRFHSEVLGLDLMVTEGRVCFYQGSARLLTGWEREQDLTQRLQREQQEVEAAQQQAEAAQQQAEAAQQQLRDVRREAILALLRGRSGEPDGALRDRLARCEDDALLQRWFEQVLRGDPVIWEEEIEA